MNKTFQSGIEMGKAHYAKIQKMGNRWKTKRIPAYIRQCMMVPYYITEVGDEMVLFIIQYPINITDRVLYVEYARHKPPD